jgi:hypothetical protein
VWPVPLRRSHRILPSAFARIDAYDALARSRGCKADPERAGPRVPGCRCQLGRSGRPRRSRWHHGAAYAFGRFCRPLCRPRLSERWTAVNLHYRAGWCLVCVDALPYLGPRPDGCGSVTRWLLGRCGGATLAARSLVDRHVDRVGAAGLVGAGRKGVTLISDGWAGGARQLPVGLGVEGFQGGGSELTQDVVGAARELASDRQRRAGVRQSAGFEREVVLVVRTGWPARGLRGFEQCPA